MLCCWFSNLVLAQPKLVISKSQPGEILFLKFDNIDQHIITVGNSSVNLWDLESTKTLQSVPATDSIPGWPEVSMMLNERKNQSFAGEERIYFANGKIKLLQVNDSIQVFNTTHRVKCSYSRSEDANQIAIYISTHSGKFNDKPKYVIETDGNSLIGISISNDSRLLAIIYKEYIQFWSLQNGKMVSTLVHDQEIPINFESTFSPNNELLVTKVMNNLWVANVKTKKIVFEKYFLGAPDALDYKYISSFAISNDSKKLAVATAGRQTEVQVLDINSGNVVRTLAGAVSRIDNADIRNPGNQLLIASVIKADEEREEYTGLIQYWDLQRGQLLTQQKGKVFTGHKSPDTGYPKPPYWTIQQIDSLAFSEIDLTGRFIRAYDSLSRCLIAQRDDVLSIINLKTRDELDLVIVDSSDWVVFHKSGLFDASPGALDKLYFVEGLNVIEFGQLKERYYEPGLWKKVMGGEKLRSVAGMKSIELPPRIRVGQVDAKGYLPIDLTNQGGGIGTVTIFINGKEIIADARTKGTDPKAATLQLKVYVANHKALIKGQENFIGVKAWNEGHWVVSRGAVVSFRADGTETTYKPAIHIIVCGVSDYTGTELDLKYAAKDAEDVGRALRLGAKNLFGIERSYVYTLTTNQDAEGVPSKVNILKAFDKVTSTAHPLDVVVMYLSGHGINHGGQDGDWYYLTQDAYTANSTAYNDPEIRRNTTLSSIELVELFKTVPALKQVLMIDACASGKVVESLIARKDIESSTLRALDRMRDRTGLHIITGCTADAVSYEASKYGQGLLTYSLLEGIRGAALREDQFVDINKLFQYAHDRVPMLAEGIGGIQTPQIFSPQGAQSFDIGLLDEADKNAIPISKIKPVYIRSTFLDDDQLEDFLQLGKKVDDALNEAASKGATANIIFVDIREYPEGCKLSGRYSQQHGIVKLKLRKKCEGKDETIQLEGKTVDEIRDLIIAGL